MRTLARCEPDVQIRRLYGYLARRGFAAGLVHDVVRRVTMARERPG
jgi:hypothetical protein